MLTISKTFKFDAAHKLPYYSGKCNKLHGHTFKLRVVITGPVIEEGPNKGMIMDFTDLKNNIVKHILSILDHNYINEIEFHGFPKDNPTAENVVVWLYKMIQKVLYGFDGFRVSKKLVSVRLWETENSWVEYQEEDVATKQTRQ